MIVNAKIVIISGANKGIGYLMLNASSRFDVPLVFAGLIVVAIMGIVIYEICAYIERRTTGWATRGATSVVSSTGGG